MLRKVRKHSRKPMKRHQVTRKTKSGRKVTYWKGRGSHSKQLDLFKQPKAGPKEYDDSYDKLYEQGIISAHEANLMRDKSYRKPR